MTNHNENLHPALQAIATVQHSYAFTFRNPLTWADIQKAMIQCSEKAHKEGRKIGAVVIKDSTYTKVVLMREAEDYIDPETRIERLKQGYMGTMFGAQVLTDAPLPDKFVDADLYIFTEPL